MDYLDLFRHYNRIPDRVYGSLKLTVKTQGIPHCNTLELTEGYKLIFAKSETRQKAKKAPEQEGK